MHVVSFFVFCEVEKRSFSICFCTIYIFLWSPNARVSRATRSQCPFEPFALAYQDSDRTAILVLQPDEAMRKHLTEAVRSRRGKKAGG